MAATSAQSKRRRFQVPITNYFTPSESQCETGLTSHYNYSAPTYSPAPNLPHKVQSSLLNVGMRVRKSVPEGYKTTPTTTKLGSYTMSYSTTNTSGNRGNATQLSYTELQPFCGIHKVGNYGVQTFPRATEEASMNMSAPHVVTDDSWDMESMPPSSQESNASTCSSDYHANKRGFDQHDLDDDEDVPLSGNIDIWQSTTTMRPMSNTPTPHISSSRTILVPKLRQRGGLQPKQQFQIKARMVGQENQDPASVMEVLDFEEATFLRRREEVDDEFGGIGIGEIEMGGV